MYRIPDSKIYSTVTCKIIDPTCIYTYIYNSFLLSVQCTYQSLLLFLKSTVVECTQMSLFNTSCCL